MKLNKKVGWYAGALLLCAMAVRASFIIFNNVVANTTGLAYNAQYVIPLQSLSANYVTAQAVYSSATIPAATFVDGAQSTGSITISNYAALVSGVDWVKINGDKYTYGFNWAAGASNSAAATNLATTINADAAINTKLTAQASGSVVTATSTLNGSAYNYPLQTSNSAAVSLSGVNMVNGTAPQFALGGSVFTATNGSGLTLALPVLYSTGSNVAIGGLGTGTTYYAVPLTGNSFSLAKFSSSAVAGLASDYVVVTSSSTQLLPSEHSFLLTPTVWAGFTSATAFSWSISADNVNWTPLTASSVTAVVNNSSTTFWSLGTLGVSYLRFNTAAPTGGAEVLKLNVMGSN